MTERQKHTRNFCIIAHIDHGKSTLADRILEKTSAVEKRDMEEQLLDDMDLERERGITIKARAVTLSYKGEDGEDYHFNLIDTPGHVDFGYEVSRSLKACEGAILVVDATQGVEAQTLANAYLAIENDLEILPVINKIDLPSADPDRVTGEIEDIIGIPAEGCPRISAKVGLNIEDVLKKIVTDIPAPSGDETAPLKCLIFDSRYDSYLGVVVYVRVFDGELKAGDKIKLMSTGATFDVVEVGTMSAFGMKKADKITAGDVGYITASIKTVGETRVGDTITSVENGASEPLPGYREV
ncbi:MAG: GTP-binding protein, partial [Clostridia bacterium]|nr:GTP-binding protein [Clostridia bacterium]